LPVADVGIRSLPNLARIAYADLSLVDLLRNRMSHAISLEPAQNKADHATVLAIARDTATSVDIVQGMFDDEVASLTAQAKVRQYIGVIATRRVRRQLQEPASATD
jgi:hypothetical protein